MSVSRFPETATFPPQWSSRFPLTVAHDLVAEELSQENLFKVVFSTETGEVHTKPFGLRGQTPAGRRLWTPRAMLCVCLTDPELPEGRGSVSGSGKQRRFQGLGRRCPARFGGGSQVLDAAQPRVQNPVEKGSQRAGLQSAATRSALRVQRRTPKGRPQTNVQSERLDHRLQQLLSMHRHKAYDRAIEQSSERTFHQGQLARQCA